MQNLEPKFSLGNIYMTAGVSEIVNNHNVDLQPYLRRHVTGDWGIVDIHDKNENELSLKNGFRLLSAYNITVECEEIKIWIISEADRSSTTILLPNEY